MKHRISKYALCPFYHKEDTQVIYCDGVQPGSVIHLAFASKTDALEYKKQHCKKDYESCKICRMFMEDYDESDP